MLAASITLRLMLLVESVFILFFISELPKLLASRCRWVFSVFWSVGVGIGTIVEFFRRKLDSIRRAAMEYSDQLADERIQEKYSVLTEVFHYDFCFPG